MAKFKLGADYSPFFANQYGPLHFVSGNGDRIELADAVGNTIVYRGVGLSSQGTQLTGGTIKKVEFSGANGEDWINISDGTFKAKDLPQSSVTAGWAFYEKGNDTFIGNADDNSISLSENPGNDKIFGMAGDDFIYASDGKNTIDGGAGTADMLYYSLASFATNPGNGGVKVDLAKGTALNPWGKTDKISGIEEVSGTKFADTFIGGKHDESFYGFQGADTYTGGKGDDVFGYSTGGGKDTIKDFGTGDDTILVSYAGIDDFHDLLPNISGDGKNTVIFFGDGDILTLLDFKNISEADFTFKTGDG